MFTLRTLLAIFCDSSISLLFRLEKMCLHKFTFPCFHHVEQVDPSKKFHFNQHYFCITESLIHFLPHQRSNPSFLCCPRAISQVGGATFPSG